jgi:hypothetical protein
MRCAECGAEADSRARGWQAMLGEEDDGSPGDVLVRVRVDVRRILVIAVDDCMQAVKPPGRPGGSLNDLKAAGDTTDGLRR